MLRHATKHAVSLALGLILIAVALNGALSAQTEPAPAAPTDWQPPVNLSRSGATDDPQVVVDSGGRYHALWRDEIDGFAYAAGDGTNWNPPAVVETPFSTRRFFPDLQPEQPTPRFTPRLAADGSGNIHAFWVDTSDSLISTLYHSRVPAGQFANFDAWSERAALDTGALLPSAALDTNGRLHIAYIRTRESDGRSAGVYAQSLPTGGTWSGPAGIYASRYLRSLTAENANVRVLPANGRVLVAWDDPGREQVFAAVSDSNGRAWGPAQEIDRRAPEDSPSASGPRGIAIGADAATLVATWRAGHEPGRTCTQYFRVSTDGGATWSLPERLSDALPDCFATTQFLTSPAGLLLLGTIQTEISRDQIDQTASLLAWDGARWSNPQTQAALSGFTNAETNQPVALRCLQAIARGEELGVVGCDQGTGGDIWWTRRAVGDATSWFPPPSVWQGPDRVATATSLMTNLQVVADEFGSTHAFWTIDGGAEIFHARYDGQSWSSAVPVLTAQSGRLAEVSVAAGNRRLYLVWRDDGGLHFAQASAERPTEWSTPINLEGVSGSAIAPAVLAAANGDLIVAYAVPLNEQRGVFVLRSEDLGVTWSAPITIFNAETAGWDMIDRPQLAQTADGVLHALYLRRNLPPDAAPVDLGYSRSDTAGRVWAPVDDNFNAPAIWSAVLGSGNVVHRLWAEDANQRTVIWHMFSPDSGVTWSEREQIAGLPGGQKPAAAVDPAARPQLAGMDGDRLVNWFWEGTAWTAAESLSTVLNPGDNMGLAADAGGRLVALTSATIPGDTDASQTDELYGMVRPLDLPAEALPTPPPPPPTATPAAEPTATPEPLPTATIAFATNPDGGPLAAIPGATTRAGQLALAIIPAGLIVLAVVVVGLRSMRGGRK